jgi:hypothetical protein
MARSAMSQPVSSLACQSEEDGKSPADSSADRSARLARHSVCSAIRSEADHSCSTVGPSTLVPRASASQHYVGKGILAPDLRATLGLLLPQ